MVEMKLRFSEIGGRTLRYRYSSHKGRYLYAKCGIRNCKAVVRYKIQRGGTYELFSAIWEHRMNSSRQIRFDGAKDYIESMPKGIPYPALRAAVCRQFLLS